MSLDGLLTTDYDVCYADTDAGGVVYYATYLAMAERSRMHLLRTLGAGFDDLLNVFDVQIMIKQVRGMYFAAAGLGDRLALGTGTLHVDAVRAWLRTRVQRGEERICDVDVEIVCLNRADRSLRLFPKALLERLNSIPRIHLQHQPAFPWKALENWPD